VAAFFSQQFTIQPGGVVGWAFGFGIRIARAGIEVFSESGSEWRYRGALSTFVTMAGGGSQISPEHFLGAIWYPKTVMILPRPIIAGALFFRATRQIPSAITFRFFGDDALD